MAVYAWALVENHFHLLCKTKKRPFIVEYAQAIDGLCGELQ